MELTQNVAAWLGWLSRVRFFLITLLLALVLVLGKTSQLEVSTRYFIPLMILWYTLAIVYTILMRWMPVASWHGRVQMVFDLIVVTVLDLPDRDAGQLLHLALPAGHHRRQYFIFAEGHVHRRGIEFHFDRGLGRADLLQCSAAHADCRAQQPPTADLDLQQFVLFHGRGVSLESAGAKPAAAGRGAGSQARGTCRTCRRSTRTLFIPCAAACSPRTWTAAFSC